MRSIIERLIHISHYNGRPVRADVQRKACLAHPQTSESEVLLLEAGPAHKKREVHIPAAFSKLFRSPLDSALTNGGATPSCSVGKPAHAARSRPYSRMSKAGRASQDHRGDGEQEVKESSIHRTRRGRSRASGHAPLSAPRRAPPDPSQWIARPPRAPRNCSEHSGPTRAGPRFRRSRRES